MATRSGTRRRAEGRTSVCGGWSHQGRLVPGLTFETSWEERALESLEGSLEEAGVVGTRCAGEEDTSGGGGARAGEGRACTEPPRCRVLVPSPQVAHLSVMFDKGVDGAHSQPCHTGALPVQLAFPDTPGLAASEFPYPQSCKDIWVKGLPSWKVEKGSRTMRGWNVVSPPTREGETPSTGSTRDEPCVESSRGLVWPQACRVRFSS